MDQISLIMNEEKNLEAKVEDLDDSIVSYDRLGHQAYKIETSEWVEVSRDGNNYSVLVLRDASGKGLCPAISCGGYLKCGSTYSRVEDLRKINIQETKKQSRKSRRQFSSQENKKAPFSRS